MTNTDKTQQSKHNKTDHNSACVGSAFLGACECSVCALAECPFGLEGGVEGYRVCRWLTSPPPPSKRFPWHVRGERERPRHIAWFSLYLQGDLIFISYCDNKADRRKISTN